MDDRLHPVREFSGPDGQSVVNRFIQNGDERNIHQIFGMNGGPLCKGVRCMDQNSPAVLMPHPQIGVPGDLRRLYQNTEINRSLIQPLPDVPIVAAAQRKVYQRMYAAKGADLIGQLIHALGLVAADGDFTG